MNTIAEFNSFGQQLEDKLMLRFSPIAFKMLYEGDAIPEGTKRPDKHLMMCQAMALVRRNRQSLTLLVEDHWCVWPVACFKFFELEEPDYEYMGTKLFIKDPEKSINFFKEKYPWFKSDKKPIGFSIAPLRSCTFVPDIVLTYCRPFQLLALVKSSKYINAELWPNTIDTIASCAYSTIPALNGQKFSVTLPDPGEFERALADENEIIFTARAEEIESLIEAMDDFAKIPFGYQDLNYDMNLECPRAQFYDDMFKKWGLATGEIWHIGE